MNQQLKSRFLMSDINRFDWKKVENWKYPYKGINDPEYLEDRNKCFKGNNGWWWGDGWWNGYHESSMEKQREYRAAKEK